MHQILLDNVIIFNHIPKAGGISLMRIFEKVYGTERCFRHMVHPPNNPEFKTRIDELTKEELDTLRFISGHFKFGNHNLLSNPVLYVGLIRDPVDRIVSDYYYNRDRGRKEFMELCKSMSLEEYVSHKFHKKQSDMVRSSQIEYLTGQQNLNEAKKIIDRHYLMVSSTRQLDSMQRIICQLAELEDSSPLRANSSSANQAVQLAPKMRKEIYDRTEVDCRLIEFIENKFDNDFVHRYF